MSAQCPHFELAPASSTGLHCRRAPASVEGRPCLRKVAPAPIAPRCTLHAAHRAKRPNPARGSQRCLPFPAAPRALRSRPPPCRRGWHVSSAPSRGLCSCGAGLTPKFRHAASQQRVGAPCQLRCPAATPAELAEAEADPLPTLVHYDRYYITT